MHLIPDVPKAIEDQIEKESLIAQRFLWQTKSDKLTRSNEKS